jgi:NADP-dependent 3-hydroxy acid dehydrogenase YdfG
MIPDPHSLFDIKGKVAVVTGASGAFGALASEVLAAAGAKLVLAAGKSKELEQIAARCRECLRCS